MVVDDFTHSVLFRSFYWKADKQKMAYQYDEKLDVLNHYGLMRIVDGWNEFDAKLRFFAFVG